MCTTLYTHYSTDNVFRVCILKLLLHVGGCDLMFVRMTTLYSSVYAITIAI